MVNKWLIVFLLTLILIVCGIHSEVPVFLVHPVSINTTEGSVVEFTCVANNTPLSLAFLVDGSSSGVDPSKGFDEQPTMGSDTLSRTLLVTALVADNDNSMIRCQAVGQIEGGSAPVTLSDIAILRVQGPLSSLVDLSYSFINSLTVTISWSPPFTLPGTDITGYNITTFTNEPMISKSFTTLPSYELSLSDVTNSSCYGIYVNVSGYNGLDGESTTLSGDPLYLPGVPSSSKIISVNHELSNDLKLNLSVNVSSLCIGEYPTHASVLTSASNGMSMNINDILLSSCTQQAQILFPNMTLINLTRFLLYNATVSYSNSMGFFTGITSTFSLDTYDLVSANVTSMLDSKVCVECVFALFSSDTAGCTVELVNTQIDPVSFNKSNTNNVKGCVNIPGLNLTEWFNVTIYDQGEQIQEFNFMVLVEPVQPTNASSNMSDNSNNTTMSPTDTEVITTMSTSSLTPSPSTITTGTISTDDLITIIVPVVAVVIIFLVLLVVILMIIYCCCMKGKKEYSNENKRNSSDGLVRSSSFTDRSPTNPPANIEDMYTKPDKTAHAPVVYAELSGFNKPHNNKVEPQSSTKRQDDRVEYSDLMIKGQPPPPPYEHTEIRETRLLSSATVIRPNHTMSKTTIVNHPDDDIQEIFFHHPNNDMSDEGSPQPPPTGSSYPPAPTGRAPSPPEDPNQPPPIPSRHHGGSQHGGNSRLPDVVSQHQNRQDYSEEGYNDESLNPTMGTLTEKQDGMFINTPAATYL